MTNPSESFDVSLYDGYSAAELFGEVDVVGKTFDDVIILPGHIDFAPHDVEISSSLTKNIKLNCPFVSSPMDTVTEAHMAIAMALEGGVGILHHYNTIEEQVDMVKCVKRYENGFILDPHVLGPNQLISDLDNLSVSGVPITEDGLSHGKVIGLVTSRDVDLVEDRSLPLKDVMVPLSEMVVGKQPCTLDEANKMLRKYKIGTLPIINEEGNLVSIVTRDDLIKNRDFPNAMKSEYTKKLIVGAAVGINTESKKRIIALVEAGVDIIVLDARQGDSIKQVELIQFIKHEYPNIEIIGGNVVTVKQLINLIEAGVDGIRVGMGTGSVSTSQEVKAVGRAQLSAVYFTSLIAKKYGIPVIADGAISSSGSAIKALSLGASCVMMGSLLAGTSESPGEYFFEEGIRVKKYHGTGSHPVINEFNHLSRLAHGVSGTVVDKGTVHQYLPYLQQSLRHGFQDMGARSIKQAHEFLYSGELRMEMRSVCAQREGGIHDLHSFTKRLFA